MLGLYKLLATAIVILCIPINTVPILGDGYPKLQCIESEEEALLKFKHSFEDTSNRLASWAGGSDCCNWEGVECNATTGHVTSLRLGNLAGLISNFDLRVNNLEWLQGLSCLKVLDLNGINLNNTADGWIHAINMMPSLAELHLSHCQLDHVPPSLPSVNIDSLVAVYLDGNKFNSTTILDWLIQSCPNIRSIDLSYNNLTGPMPSTWDQTHSGKHSSLRELRLSNNHLYGPLTRSLAQFPELVRIDVDQNDLQDVITDADFRNLNNLEVLILSGNRVTFEFDLTKNWVPPFQLQILDLRHCLLGPQFPNWIQTQNNLSYVDISFNNISDTVPNWFWNICGNMQYLNLSYNNLRGHVADFSSHLKLRTLDLSNNSFACPFPYLPPNIWELNLAKNSFFGPLSHICEMDISNLEFLDLSSNNLSGNLPNCWIYGTNLSVLFLAENNFSGPIPDSFGSLTSLQALNLNKNNFSGTLPLSLKNCGLLTLLDVGNNQLSGTIPSWIGRDMQDLLVLKLRSNAFEKNIPKTLCQLQFLQILDLSLNHLSGTIPPCIFMIMAKKEIDFTYPFSKYFYNHVYTYSDYKEPLFLAWKGSYLTIYGEIIFSLLQFVDLSSNFITGDIPEEITSYDGLKSLNLSRNQLVGSIPWKIGEMKSLEVLDLSWNNLSSIIPTSLSDMDQLGILDVSHNNLTGQIPLGNHLDTFGPSFFDGNPNLCGRPLNKSCNTNQSFEDPHEKSKERAKRDGLKIPSFYFSMELGFVAGFWAIWGPLILNKRWRRAYFTSLGNMYDKLYVIVAVTTVKWRRKLRNSQ